MDDPGNYKSKLSKLIVSIVVPRLRIHWAGGETPEEWTGYIEGALRAGIRAAKEDARRHNA